MEVIPMEHSAWYVSITSRKQRGMFWMSSGFSYEPSHCLKLWFCSTSVANFWGVKDPHYGALTGSLDSGDIKEIMKIAREADDYTIT